MKCNYYIIMMEQFSCPLIFFFFQIVIHWISHQQEATCIKFACGFCVLVLAGFVYLFCVVSFLMDRFGVFNSDIQNSRSTTDCQFESCVSQRGTKALYIIPTQHLSRVMLCFLCSVENHPQNGKFQSEVNIWSLTSLRKHAHTYIAPLITEKCRYLAEGIILKFHCP